SHSVVLDDDGFVLIDLVASDEHDKFIPRLDGDSALAAVQDDKQHRKHAEDEDPAHQSAAELDGRGRLWALAAVSPFAFGLAVGLLRSLSRALVVSLFVSHRCRFVFESARVARADHGISTSLTAFHRPHRGPIAGQLQTCPARWAHWRAATARTGRVPRRIPAPP